jgi:hypothetical protein
MTDQKKVEKRLSSMVESFEASKACSTVRTWKSYWKFWLEHSTTPKTRPVTGKSLLVDFFSEHAVYGEKADLARDCLKQLGVETK